MRYAETGINLEIDLTRGNIEKVATDVKAVRIDGLGRSIKPRADLTALFAVIREIRRFKPDVIHTHTAKAGVVGRVASILSGHRSVRVHTFHGHLLNGYFSAGKTKLVIQRALIITKM